MKSQTLRAWIVISGTLCAVQAAHAAGGNASYNIRHTFDLHLNQAPNQVYRGQWAWYAKAKAVGSDGTDNGAPPNETGAYAFNPPRNDFRFCDATRNGATASSDTQFDAGANGTGFHQITGFASVVAPNGIYARGSSGSALALNVGTVNRRGVIRWNPNWSSDTIDSSASVGRDPLDIQITNLDDGSIQNSTLWDTGFGLDGGGGHTDWGAGHMHISGGNGSFFLKMESPYLTTGTGHINLTFANGLVTTSDDTGVFDGILPSLGASSYGLDLAIGDASGNIDLGYDFGADNASGFDSGFSFSGDGMAEATPEPATYLVLGLGAIAVIRRKQSNR